MRSLARLFWTKYHGKPEHTTDKTQALLAPLFLYICESSLPESEKEVGRLAQEGFVMVSAGGETTSRVLSMAIFYIVSNSRILKRLQNEVMEVMPDVTISPSLKALDEMVYLVIAPHSVSL